MERNGRGLGGGTMAQEQAADYAHTLRAAKNRYAKAQEISRRLWEAGVVAAQLDLWTDEEWARASQRLLGRSASDETRLLVYAMLVVKQGWAAAHVTDPGAQRPAPSDEAVAALIGTRRRGARPPGAGPAPDDRRPG